MNGCLNSRLEAMRERVRNREHLSVRQRSIPDLISEGERDGLSWMQRSARLTRRMCEAEQPVILPGERIVFTRTVPQVPQVFSPEDLSFCIPGSSRGTTGKP